MRSVRKSDLVAITAAPSAAWLTWIRAAWDVGAAVLPIDDRLPRAEVDRLLERVRPTAIYDGAQFLRVDGEPVDDGIALVVSTSGSAGEPKAAELTHDALRAAVRSSAERLGLDQDDRWLCCLPPAHMGGMLVLLRGVLVDRPVVVQARFSVSAFTRSTEWNCTSLVPTMLARLLEAGTDLDRFKAILVGGASMDERLRTRAVVTTYGMTESCGGVIYDGRPLDGVEVRVGGDEEIQLHGPTLMRGYRFATSDPFTPDGWLRTRDAGSLEGGVLTVLGRLDDVIITGGEKVWPEEVEAVLRAHPAVADAAVVGTPNPEWGARVTAFVVPVDPAEPPLLEALRAHCAERIAGYKAPRTLHIIEAVPRTSSGKIRRSDLQARSGS